MLNDFGLVVLGVVVTLAALYGGRWFVAKYKNWRVARAEAAAAAVSLVAAVEARVLALEQHVVQGTELTKAAVVASFEAAKAKL